MWATSHGFNINRQVDNYSLNTPLLVGNNPAFDVPAATPSTT